MEGTNQRQQNIWGCMENIPFLHAPRGIWFAHLILSPSLNIENKWTKAYKLYLWYVDPQHSLLKYGAVPIIYILSAFPKQYVSTELPNTPNDFCNYFLKCAKECIWLVPF